MKSFSELQQHSSTLSYEFLILDIQTAGTFLDVAKTTRNEDTRSRNLSNAAKAYAAILRLHPGVFMTELQRAELQADLEALKARMASVNPSWLAQEQGPSD